MILLGTDVCSELIEGNERILQRRDQYDGVGGVGFMTVEELYCEAEESKEPSQDMETIDRLLLSLEMIHAAMPILRRFGAIKVKLQKDGIPIADADTLIASAAIEKAERLITGNPEHCDRVRGRELEDWT